MRPNKTILAVLLLTVAMLATVTTAEAAQDLKITDHNLYALKYWGSWTSYGSGELLRWEGYPATLDANYQKQRMVGSIRATTVADNNGWYWGQCVSLVKALSKNNVATSNWQRGDKVMTSYNVMPGTVIATFNSNGNYYGHVAIFRGYIYNNGRVGIMVYDQNYVSPYVVGKHDLMAYGTGVSDADNYYVVRVP